VSVRKAIVTTLVLAGLVAAAFFAFARGGPRAAALRQKQSSHPASEASPAAGEPDEVRRLRAEVKTKDNIIRAFATHALTSEADHEAKEAATVAAVKRSQTDRALEALDARIAAALPDVAAKTELEQALRPAFESAGFVGARVAEVRCAGDLCKVAVSTNGVDELRTALEEVASHLPKTFPAMITLPGQGDGDRALYFGRSPAAIDVRSTQ
jgi:hypothetical protein